ncbi:MAG TPA: hypothetical protein VGX78_19865, partial [Pirellulales bacterium]|nr:hypothetical protein [Pirellulales bacterium]
MISSAAIAAVLFFSPSFVEPDQSASKRVEHVTKKPQRTEGLGTKKYEPSEAEQPFYDKLAADEVATGGLVGEYDIHAKQGKYVGWFGIVRDVAEDVAQDRTTLLVEHKYFDGLTDLHIQALSFNGAGDFQAIVPGVGHEIEPLSLVKVYGTVAKAEKKDDPPSLQAEFVRDWHWGTFTFLGAFGEQQGSEKWRKFNRVELDDIYDPYPDDDYYQQRLGERPDEEAQANARRSAFRAVALQAATAVNAGAEA